MPSYANAYPSPKTLCLCGSDKNYQDCCKPFHERELFPETAEQLMRSRYVAYALKLKTYLAETWHSSTRPSDLEFDPQLSWTKLIINGRKKGRKKDREGWVTFSAFYQIGQDRGQLQEKSYFARDDNQHWCYVEGEIR